MEVAIPKLRKGTFFPELFEPRRRIGRALWASSCARTSRHPSAAQPLAGPGGLPYAVDPAPACGVGDPKTAAVTGTDMHPKISATLAEALNHGGGADPIAVVIELRTPPVAEGVPSRAAAVAARQSGFAEAADPVRSEVRRSGGDVVDEAWINQTMRVQLPAEAVTRIADLDQVAAVDLPRPIAAD